MKFEYILTSQGELYHHGIKGMKWGVRRYQRKDGSLTPAGKKRQQILDAAAEQAKSLAKQADTDKAHFEKMAKKHEAKSGTEPTQKQIQKYLRDQFGNDIDTKQGRASIKKDFEIDTTLEEWAAKELNADNEAKRYRALARDAAKMGEYYMKRAKHYSSMNVSEISNKDVKKAKKYIKSNYHTLYTGSDLDWYMRYDNERYGDV